MWNHLFRVKIIFLIFRLLILFEESQYIIFSVTSLAFVDIVLVCPDLWDTDLHRQVGVDRVVISGASMV